eukprot:m.26788 g.26788  ORF g.26788 m.26788 type:complete len:318 (+) comp4332_c0_seq1:113-1066(+)
MVQSKQASRALAGIPAEALREPQEPVLGRTQPADGRHRKRGQRYPHALPLSKLVLVASIHGDPCRLAGHTDLEVDGRWDDDRPERERVRADGRDQEARHLRVHHRAASRDRVCRAAGGRGDDQAVALHGRHDLAVAEDLEASDVRRRTAVQDNLVEHVEGANGFERGTFAHDGAHAAPEVDVLAVRRGRAGRRREGWVALEDLALDAHAHRHAARAVKGERQRVVEVPERKWRQEAERAERKAEDRRADALEERRHVQERAVAAQQNAEVDDVGIGRGPGEQILAFGHVLSLQLLVHACFHMHLALPALEDPHHERA